ncbi:heavy metal translocatin [Punctularia strigosozonata HHB-11173 SS5]|uniref:heavy metal translocatin n=1 Tax=Punctularia strigosozonata (strain HHB-11173) TaxID=741275 RepID=UPI000441635E|nr:heavy metal translocatin [Punctularia strigosozonata HHB-11173 SS5]EIN10752.1 heavy metal translocatin [Punctularia strigosozonata HHB-11173 SS5]
MRARYGCLQLTQQCVDPDDAVTTILVSNLHCSSCVRTIQDALNQLTPAPTSVLVSVVSQSVTVHHSKQLLEGTIRAAIDEAGFDLVSTPAEDASTLYSAAPRARRTSLLSRKREKHAAQCQLCQQGEVHGHEESEKLLREATSEGVATLSVENGGYAEHEDVDKSQQPSLAPARPEKAPEPALDISAEEGPYYVTVSVGGMTCVSCSNTITDVVSQVDGVLNVVVNLLGNSASVTVKRRDIVPTVLETIEDCGFEAELMDVEPVKTARAEVRQETVRRTITLKIDGMFCRHCPARVMSALEPFISSGQLQVEKPITSHTDPLMRINYTPSPPDITIRTIVAAIAASKSPDPDSKFAVSPYDPPTLEDRARAMQQREKRHLLHRLLFSVVVAIPTFIIGIVYMSLVPDDDATKDFLMRPMWAGNVSRVEWALFILATPVMFYSAGMFHRRSLKEIRGLWRPGSKTPVWKRFVRFGSMNLLVSTGVAVAYFSSIVLLGLATAQRPSPMGHGDTTTYFDSVVFLTMFLLCGRFLEAYSKGHTSDAIMALGKLRPSEALLVSLMHHANTPDRQSLSGLSDRDVEKGDPDHEKMFFTKPGMKLERVDVGLLEVGDVVRVVNGSTPPADGTILTAPSDGAVFDESSLTGESRLVKKVVGDPVFLGTINRGNPIDVRVDTIGGETMLDHVVKVVREGQTKRAPIERVADLVTAYFVPVITLLAVLTWVIWLSLGLSGSLPAGYLDIEVGGWIIWSLEFAIAVFVVACPCGIGLAAPTALLVGSGLAAKYGILARGGGEAFQETAQLDCIVFDKTGTLTEGGNPKVTNARLWAANWDPKTILGIAIEIESASSHPLALAIDDYCKSQGCSPISGLDYEETPGRGIKARFTSLGCSAIIGNEAWIEENGGKISGQIVELLAAWKSEGQSVVLLALRKDFTKDGEQFTYEVVAVFAVSDPIREEAKAVVASLQDRGLATWMISGDNAITAKAVARLVGIPETNVIAGVLPHEKAEKIQWLQQVGPKRRLSRLAAIFGKRRLNDRCIVAMVGDGINDAPALSSADVGIAIGSGSDVAISSAAFILVSSNLKGILVLCELSRKVFNRVKFNFFWAGVYNIAALPIAAGVVYPAGHARLAPVWASLAMALSSVSVVCSSLLLKLYKPKLA